MSGGVVWRRGLFDRLDRAGRVAVVSAPPGSGKTVLLRSWIGQAGLAGRAGWVPVQRGERDPQRFWISVADALRGTAPGSELVRELSAAPDLDGWAIVERLLKDLAALEDRVWLVIDDVHELGPAEALAQLELLVMRAPAELRFVLATRHDLRLGLHRLRLAGELTEIRAADLRFTVEEARQLLEAAGVELPEPALARLQERTEGWAAGLRLAALSLAGHPDPERFAAEFSGSERTVAEYLLAEVLDRQPRPVRRLLLRTSVLERVNGELADLLTGRSGGGRILRELEQANAFVVSLDAARTWFRYHRLFAGLLQLELRASEPDQVPALHAAAAGWFAGHGVPVEAVRHAQAAGAWGLATRLLADHWFSLVLDGQAATARQLLAGFPADLVTADAELTTLRAASEVTRGSPQEAERYLELAAETSAAVPDDRRGRLQIMLAILRLWLARQRGDLPAAVEEAQRLLAPAESPDARPPELREDLRALALISLGVAEFQSIRFDEAHQDLGAGIALAHQIGRPYLELTGLVHLAEASFPSARLVEQRAMQAIELAGRHGWGEGPNATLAYIVLTGPMLWRGRLDEAEHWLGQAERTARAGLEPQARMMLHMNRGLVELLRGRDASALAAFRAAEPLAELVVKLFLLVLEIRKYLVQALVRMGEIGRAEAVLAGLDEQERATAEMRTALAALRLAQHDPQAATAALAPVLDGSVFVATPAWAGVWLGALRPLPVRH